MARPRGATVAASTQRGARVAIGSRGAVRADRKACEWQGEKRDAETALNELRAHLAASGIDLHIGEFNTLLTVDSGLRADRLRTVVWASDEIHMTRYRLT